MTTSNEAGGVEREGKNKQLPREVAVLIWFGMACGASCQPLSMRPISVDAAQPTMSRKTLTTFEEQSDLPSGASLWLIADKLILRAEGASLTKIVQSIADLYGVEIIGSLEDERVYGVYGPGDISSILWSLLEGTGNNMLLRTVGTEGKQIILTPRLGSVTPPETSSGKDATFSSLSSGNSYGLRPHEFPESKRVLDKSPYARGGNSAPIVAVPRVLSSTTAAPMPGPAPVMLRIPVPAALLPPLLTLHQSPNGVKTPEEIKASLRKLQEDDAMPSIINAAPLR